MPKTVVRKPSLRKFRNKAGVITKTVRVKGSAFIRKPKKK
jgi:hypothetical protein